MTIRFDRLLKLAEFGETKIPEERFDYGDFANGTTLSLEPWCETSACMFGWATTIPEFRDAGLRLVEGAPTFEGHKYMDAAAAFFELDIEDAGFLFDPGYNYMTEHASPVEVAAHIRRFVEERRK